MRRADAGKAAAKTPSLIKTQLKPTIQSRPEAQKLKPKPLGPEQLGIIALKIEEEIELAAFNLKMFEEQQGNRMDRDVGPARYSTSMEGYDEHASDLELRVQKEKLEKLLRNKRRIQEGTFQGICLECRSETIPFERFMADPSVCTCIHCAPGR